MNRHTAFILFIMFLQGCEKNTLDYEKIDFQVRKKVMSSWYGFVNPTITKKTEVVFPLYRLYENKISDYQKDLLRSLKRLDTLNNHKDIWIASITSETLSKDPKERLEHSYFFASPEDEYNSILESSYETQRELTRRLDSIEALYNEVSKEVMYYELFYEINAKSTTENGNSMQ